MARTVLLAAASELEPLEQGKLDGLCGLYAIVNGIRVAAYPECQVGLKVQRQLFRHGVAFLGRTRHLSTIVHAGMSGPLWRRMFKVMVTEAYGLTGTRLYYRFILMRDEPPTSRLAVQLIRRSLREGNPVILTFWGRLNHTSVAVGFSDTRLILFDSFGLRWVALSGIGVDGDRSIKRHRLRASGVVSLSRFN